MGRSGFRTVLLGTALAGLLAAGAHAQTIDAEEEDALDAPSASDAGVNVPPSIEGEELERAQERRRVLFQQMLLDPANLDIAFEYAGLSAQVGDIEASIATLERMLLFAPGLPRLQLELGVLYFRLGAYETARYYFESAVSTPNVPEVVRSRVDPYLAEIDRRTAGYRLTGYFLGGIRYQTNANAAPAGGTVTIIGIPGFQLDDDATGQPDWNSFFASNHLLSYDLENQGDTFDINLLTYGAVYDEQQQLNTGLAEFKFGPVFDLTRFGIENTAYSPYAILNGIMLGGDPYEVAGGAGQVVSSLLNPQTRVSVQGEYRREEFFDSGDRPTASDRSGHRGIGSGRMQMQLHERFSIFASLDAERRFTQEDYLDSWEWAGTAGWALALSDPSAGEPLTFALSGGYLEREFDAPDPAIDPNVTQVDEEMFVTGTLVIPIGNEGWAIQAVGGYRDVVSTYEIRTFENIHGSAALRKRF